MRTRLSEALAEMGLLLRGGFELAGDEGLPPLPDGGAARSLALVGNAGSALWPIFRDSPERQDGEPDSLDRWTRRVLSAIVERFGAGVLFPFGGPPHYPFQRWAQRAEPVKPSPLGILIHPDYGLWHAYRGALLLGERLDWEGSGSKASPCDSCPDRPCLSHCPVDAFSAQGYDVAACVGHIRGRSGEACLSGGCLAREACPAGSAYRYEAAHKAFHMAAFLSARLKEERD
jgi:hypothetical protein